MNIANAVAFMKKHCRKSSMSLDRKCGYRRKDIQRMYGLSDSEYDQAVQQFLAS